MIVDDTFDQSLHMFLRTPESERDKDWICKALQAAVRLEFATIPPYLVAMWSVNDKNDDVRAALAEIVRQEMLHMGIACNLLTTLGVTPQIDDPCLIPQYPGHLPWHVHPHLMISLRRLSLRVVEHTFMEIEKPEFTPIVWHRGIGYPTIGAFYSAIYGALENLSDKDITGDRQLITKRKIALTPITKLCEALKAVETVKEQGEGTRSSPLFGPSKADVAHYYRFGEILHQRRLKEVDGDWSYCGDRLRFPREKIRPMAPIPPGGYPEESADFDRLFTVMLHKMQHAWTYGRQSDLDDAVGIMRDQLGPIAECLMERRIDPHEKATYGPSFLLCD